MKRKILFCLIAVCFFSKGFSQNISDSTKSNLMGIINVNYLEVLGGELRVTYEKPMNRNISSEFGGSIIYYSYLKNTETAIILGGHPLLGIGLGLRYGLKIYNDNSLNHEGWYYNPLIFFKFFYHEDPPPNSTQTINSYTLGFQILMGYKTHSEKKWTFDWYLGVGGRLIYIDYYYPPNSQNIYYVSSNHEIIKYFSPQTGFTIGYKLFKK